MGLSMEESLGSLRLTTGYATTDDEISRAIVVLRTVLNPRLLPIHGGRALSRTEGQGQDRITSTTHG